MITFIDTENGQLWNSENKYFGSFYGRHGNDIVISFRRGEALDHRMVADIFTGTPCRLQSSMTMRAVTPTTHQSSTI